MIQANLNLLYYPSAPCLPQSQLQAATRPCELPRARAWEMVTAQPPPPPRDVRVLSVWQTAGRRLETAARPAGCPELGKDNKIGTSNLIIFAELARGKCDHHPGVPGWPGGGWEQGGRPGAGAGRESAPRLAHD